MLRYEVRVYLSIKTKLSLIISSTLLVIMFLNIALSYYSTKENLRTDSETKIMLTAKQIAIEVDQAHKGAAYVEQLLDEKLRLASLYAAQKLPSDIRRVSSYELEALSRSLGISHISLIDKSDRDHVILRSSNLTEIGRSTKDWYYNADAFELFFTDNSLTGTNQVHKTERFWSAPLGSSVGFNRSDKRAYYDDGKRNYVINPYIGEVDLNQYYSIADMDGIVRKTIEANPNILEVTGIFPDIFSNKIENSPQAQNSSDASKLFKNQAISFGTYSYADPENDMKYVLMAARGECVIFDEQIDGKEVIKSFIPVPHDSSYVISIVLDYNMISSVLKEQLVNHIAISIVLLEIIIIFSYLLAGRLIRPVKSILDKVNEVANGHFGARLKIKSKDELGLLARRINTMTRNLSIYTNQLKQTYEENRAMKEYLESFINQTSDAIHVVDLEGKVILANSAFEQLFGWKVENVIGHLLRIIPEDKLEEEDRVSKWLIAGRNLMARETQRITREGRTLDVSVSTSPIYDQNGECIAFASITRDITENKKMEELLRRSEKLTTVGQLAAGVAHEIRNPLTTLRGFLQFQKQTSALNVQHTDLMLSELDRINLIVSEFLILAKPQAIHFQKKDVRCILEDVLSLMDSQTHLFNINFVVDFTSESCMIECEENHLKQVFINVLKNAFESMPSGGEITIQLDLLNGIYVRVRITDQGRGIPEENLSKLGQPFFTDKETGTGLGLMVSQRIIQSHKGTLEISSVVHQGTTVTIILPMLPGGEFDNPNGPF